VADELRPLDDLSHVELDALKARQKDVSSMVAPMERTDCNSGQYRSEMMRLFPHVHVSQYRTTSTARR
jgi:hypothetical protein